MHTKFSKNLTKYRKRCGLTQSQLAEKLSVTPQAVSKWENGSLPDSEFLPRIAFVLGISLDVLFGLAQEQEEPDLEQMISDKIRHTAAEERADVVMQLFYAVLTAYHDYKLSKQTCPENLELETFAELKSDYECAIARLNDDLKYFCFLKIPENGVNAYIEDTDTMVRLFETLADKDALRIIHYLGSGMRNRMQSLGMISSRVGMPVEKVRQVMDRLDRFGLVWRVSVEISDDPSIVYGYVNSMPLLFILTMAKSLTRYIRFHDLYIDTWKQGPFRMPDVANTDPVPQISFWDAEPDGSKQSIEGGIHNEAVH